MCVAIREEKGMGEPSLAVTGSADKSVRVWDITQREKGDNLHRNKFLFSGHSRKVSFDLSIPLCTHICKSAFKRRKLESPGFREQRT